MIKEKMKYIPLFLVLVGFFHIGDLYAQDESLYSLSLEELMSVDIVSASNRKEALFEAPVSSYSITRDEISKSGATSIPEALRLAPGVIVRETTNGNYDVHIRGFDNIARYTTTRDQSNVITLVMIDNRPVFNYNQGGTLWESLPVDLIDVERIEVVRGPSAPLFGPNAVSGVINIITRRPEEEGVYASGNLQVGSENTFVGNVAVSGKLSDVFSMGFSGNFQQRNRHDSLYYDFIARDYFDSPGELPTVISTGFVDRYVEKFPDTEKSMEKLGANIFFNFTPSEDVSIDLSAGLQDAQVQKVYFDDPSPLSYSENDSRYVNLAVKAKGLGFKYSLTTGFNDLDLNSYEFISKYDLNVTDIVLDYTWDVSDKVTLRPSFNYQQAKYDARDYQEDVDDLYTFLDEVADLQVAAGGLRVDYFPVEHLRLIGAVRSDNFNVPSKSYLTYQVGATYMVNDQYLFRLMRSNSNSGAFVASTVIQARSDNGVFTGVPGLLVKFLGDEDLDLALNTMTEIGFRAKFAENFQFDLAVFTQVLEDVSSIVIDGTLSEVDPEDGSIILGRNVNLPVSARQSGATISANYVPNEKWQIKPFFTFSTTEAIDIPINMDVSLTDTFDDTHESTPSLYGGAFINFAPSQKFNINLNSYFFSAHRQYHEDDPDQTNEDAEIDGKLILNLKAAYKPAEKLSLFFNARNLLNNDSREIFGADRNGGMFLGGVSYNF